MFSLQILFRSFSNVPTDGISWLHGPYWMSKIITPIYIFHCPLYQRIRAPLFQAFMFFFLSWLFVVLWDQTLSFLAFYLFCIWSKVSFVNTIKKVGIKHIVRELWVWTFCTCMFFLFFLMKTRRKGKISWGGTIAECVHLFSQSWTDAADSVSMCSLYWAVHPPPSLLWPTSRSHTRAALAMPQHSSS